MFRSDTPRRAIVFQLKQWRVTASGQISPAVVKVSQMKQKQQFDGQSNLWNRLQPCRDLLPSAGCLRSFKNISQVEYEIIVSAPCF